jgi:nitronate monooxygenase
VAASPGELLILSGPIKLMKTRLTELLQIDYPIIMAPMFLVTNTEMMLAALDSGISACIPALNFRKELDFRNSLSSLNQTKKSYGVNLIVNKSNLKLKSQLDICLEYQVPYIITSLGNPAEIIQCCKKQNIRVFCDVSDLDYAKKAARSGPDGLIAVTNEAGGHLGIYTANEFIPVLVKEFPELLIISAGGVGDKKSLDEKLALGAAGVSVGSLFIASDESQVCAGYKQACVNYGAHDIVTTTKLSGIPCTVINTAYVQKIGTKQNWIQSILNNNRRLKKWLKLLTYIRGMSILRKAAFDAGYQNVWCAGKTIRYVNSIKPIKEIIQQLVTEK